jgi:hypothetical protein
MHSIPLSTRPGSRSDGVIQVADLTGNAGRLLSMSGFELVITNAGENTFQFRRKTQTISVLYVSAFLGVKH